MSVSAPYEERLTVASAMTYVLSVGVVLTLPSLGMLPTLVAVLSAVSFVFLYANK